MMSGYVTCGITGIYIGYFGAMGGLGKRCMKLPSHGLNGYDLNYSLTRDTFDGGELDVLVVTTTYQEKVHGFRKVCFYLGGKRWLARISRRLRSARSRTKGISVSAGN